MIIRWIVRILLSVWMAPMMIAGLVIILFNKDQILWDKVYQVDFYFWIFPARDGLIKGVADAISFGFGAVIDPRIDWDTVVRHEYGHGIGYRILGPIAVFLIAIPSLLFKWIWMTFKVKKDYHKLPWEWWADKCGGVTRG